MLLWAQNLSGNQNPYIFNVIFKIKINAKIHDGPTIKILNNDRVSVADFSICDSLPYGSEQRCGHILSLRQ